MTSETTPTREQMRARLVRLAERLESIADASSEEAALTWRRDVDAIHALLEREQRLTELHADEIAVETAIEPSPHRVGCGMTLTLCELPPGIAPPRGTRIVGGDPVAQRWATWTWDTEPYYTRPRPGWRRPYYPITVDRGHQPTHYIPELSDLLPSLD